MLKLTKKVKWFLFFLFLLLFAYLNYSFIYQPRNARILQLDNQISTLESKIEEGKAIAARLPELRKEYQELIDRLKFVEVLLPTEKDIPDFLVLLEDTMKEFNINFTNFSPQNLTQEKEEIFARLPISMNFDADYFETIQFLDRLENFPRIVDVKDLKINPSSENQKIINVAMNMFTYVLTKGNK